MNLAYAYFALASFLLISGGLIIVNSNILRTFRRSQGATLILGLAAIFWFGWWLLKGLPEADFAGLPRGPVIALFIGGSLAAFFTMPDLLSVRSLGVLMIFLARSTLDAGFQQLPYSLLAASVSYGVLILFGFWWACSPPVFCRQCDWLLLQERRRFAIGGLCLLLSLACIAQIFFLP